MAVAQKKEIQIDFSQEQLVDFLKNQKLINYLTTNLSNQYLVIEEAGARIILSSTRSQVEIPLEGLASNEPVYTTIDVGRFMTALKKLSQNTSVAFKISQKAKTIILLGLETQDKITLGVSYFDDDDSTILDVLSFVNNQADLIDEMINYNTTKSSAFLKIASTFLGNNAKNNAINISKTQLKYADRTVVLQTTIKDLITDAKLKDDSELSMHETTINFVDFIQKDNPEIRISGDSNYVYWEAAKDSPFRAFLVQEALSISIPTEDELEFISPSSDYVKSFNISNVTFSEGLDFFTGMFEASLWKPITFSYDEETPNEIALSYSHPTASLDKKIPLPDISGNDLISERAEFLLINDSIRTILGALPKETLVKIDFNDVSLEEQHGLGVRMTLTPEDGVQYVAVLAKLQDM